MTSSVARPAFAMHRCPSAFFAGFAVKDKTAQRGSGSHKRLLGSGHTVCRTKYQRKISPSTGTSYSTPPIFAVGEVAAAAREPLPPS